MWCACGSSCRCLYIAHQLQDPVGQISVFRKTVNRSPALNAKHKTYGWCSMFPVSSELPFCSRFIVQFFNSSKDSMKTCESVRITPCLLCVVRVWSSGECSELVTALVEMSFMLLTVSLPNNLISVALSKTMNHEDVQVGLRETYVLRTYST